MESDQIQQQLAELFSQTSPMTQELFKALVHQSRSGASALQTLENAVAGYARNQLSDDELNAAASRSLVKKGERKTVPKQYHHLTPPEL